MLFVAATALAGFAGIASATVIGAGVNVNAQVQVGAIAQVNANAGVSIVEAQKQCSGFKCPDTMTYCPWTKSCSCPPGQTLAPNTTTCTGTVQTGAWPEPDVKVYQTSNVQLATYCAISPTKMCRYNAAHEYCQAGLNTVTFCAPASIEAEIVAKAEIDLHAGISADLKSTCAGLTSLYLEKAADAAVLFNTNALGLITADVDVEASLGWDYRHFINGGGDYDCVSHCTKGCKNYIEVEGGIGARIGGLAGLCILPDVFLTIGASKQIVSYATQSLLCVVGGLIKTVISTFDCHCH